MPKFLLIIFALIMGGSGGDHGALQRRAEAYRENQQRIGFVEQPKRVLYLSSYVAGGGIDKYINICDQTEINALVIDIKPDESGVSFKGGEFADGLGISVNRIPDITGLMAKLKEHNIYTIARIVAFKDTMMVQKRPEFALLRNGAPYEEKGLWMNPYVRETWEYLLNVAKAAADVGFDEIQFDYFRFPTRTIDSIQNETKSKTEIITECAKYLTDGLRDYGVLSSVDVYAAIIVSPVDSAIVGQDYAELCKLFDYVCPMAYPSHYEVGSFRIDNPDLYPYEVLEKTMSLSNEKLAEIPEGVRRAEIRVWLQAFTASYLKTPYQEYGAKQIREQIDACYDTGYYGWLLWNASNVYDTDSFLTTVE